MAHCVTAPDSCSSTTLSVALLEKDKEQKIKVTAKDIHWRDKKVKSSSSKTHFLWHCGPGCGAKAVIMGEKLSRFRALTLLELLVSVTTSHLSPEVYYSMVK